jgi:pimeloyl-ACP methyl ester carboxylesterase
MATYVLVGGAWIGSWAWKAVAQRLRSQGHDVHPVTLTGLGERAHLARPEIDLETHITDVVNVIGYEDLAGVILVGHSYAGIVVTGVADRAADRLAQLVYLDSAPLGDGATMLDLYPPDAAEQLRRQVDEAGEGWLFAFPSFDELATTASLAGLGQAERNLMQAKAVPQPFQTYTQPLRLTGTGRDGFKTAPFKRVAIACDDMRTPIESGPPELQALRVPPWRYHALPTGHWPMLSMPDELAALLHRLSTEP